MKNSLHVVIPSRFLSTIAHFIVLIMAYYNKDNNIKASLAISHSTADYNVISSSISLAFAFSLVCIAIELIGLVAGYSMFNVAANGFYVIVHSAAAILLTWYIIDSWHYLSFWYIWIFLTFLPACLEVFIILKVYCCQTAHY